MLLAVKLECKPDSLRVRTLYEQNNQENVASCMRIGQGNIFGEIQEGCKLETFYTSFLI